MKFFIDTASVEEIREANAMGVLDGVTTNPSLVSTIWAYLSPSASTSPWRILWTRSQAAGLSSSASSW